VVKQIACDQGNFTFFPTGDVSRKPVKKDGCCHHFNGMDIQAAAKGLSQ
jgi:hypothetical protein